MIFFNLNLLWFISFIDAEKIGLELKKLSCEHRPTERWRPNLPQFIAM